MTGITVTVPIVLESGTKELRLRGSARRDWVELSSDLKDRLELDRAVGWLGAARPEWPRLTAQIYYDASILDADAELAGQRGPSAQAGAAVVLASLRCEAHRFFLDGDEALWITGGLSAEPSRGDAVTKVDNFDSKLDAFRSSKGARVFICPCANRNPKSYRAAENLYEVNDNTVLPVWSIDRFRTWLQTGSVDGLPRKVLVFVQTMDELLLPVDRSRRHRLSRGWLIGAGLLITVAVASVGISWRCTGYQPESVPERETPRRSGPASSAEFPVDLVTASAVYMPLPGSAERLHEAHLEVEPAPLEWPSDGRRLVFLEIDGIVCRGIWERDAILGECQGSPFGGDLPAVTVPLRSPPELVGADRRQVLYGVMSPSSGYAHGAIGYAVVTPTGGAFIPVGRWWFTSGDRRENAGLGQRGWLVGGQLSFDRWARLCRNLNVVPSEFILKSCIWQRFRRGLAQGDGAL